MNLNINTGEIRLTINDDPNRIVAFNPNDLDFVESFYSLISSFESKEQGYSARLAELNGDAAVDAYGIPKNTKAHLALIRDICDDLKTEIDTVFGDGTSKAAFGSAITLDMFEQFFEGITPFIQSAREEKISKYTGNREQRRAMQ